MAKIFITGATGQVGNQVARYIITDKVLDVTRPEDVICLVRNPDKAAKLKELGVTIIEGDLLDSDTISDIMNSSIDYVFHIAANILLNQTYEQMYKPNVLGTRLMIDAFVKSKAKCFIYTSSIGVYEAFNGKEKTYTIYENSPIGPLDGQPYPVTKRIAENIVNDYSKRHPDKKFVITRLGPIVSAGDRQTMPNLVKLLSYRALPKLINKGKNLFSITSSIDVARAQVYLAEYNDDISGEEYNIALEPISYKEIMDVIAEYYNRNPPTFSIQYWFFRLLLPLLRVLNKIFPKFELIKIALSPVAISYIGKTLIYSSDKLKALGFEFKISSRQAIIDSLVDLDPDKELVKPSRRLKFKK